MPKLKRIVLLFFVLLSCVGCDRATKIMARQELATAPMQAYGNGFFRLVYAENPGAFLSLGAGLHPEVRFWIFTVFVALLLSGLAWFVLRYIQKAPLPFVVAVALIAGGGLGNLIDRLIYGAVADFLNVPCCGIVNPYSFNIADIAIFVGAAGLVLFAGERGKRP